MKRAIWLLIILLILLHHDFWYWDSPDLVADFLPIGMAYHIGVSIAAAVLWYLATVFAWPDNVHVEAPDPDIK